jgi:CDP-paratose 2-epimerase
LAAISRCRSASFAAAVSPGPQHAAVELHGYLAYIIICAMTGKEYQIYGYKGKQVRDKGYRKYLRAGGKQFAVDEDKIQEEARYDGKWGC